MNRRAVGSYLLITLMHILNPEGILPTYTKLSRVYCGIFVCVWFCSSALVLAYITILISVHLLPVS